MKTIWFTPDLKTEAGRAEFRAIIEDGILRGWIKRPTKFFNYNRHYEQPIQGLDTSTGSRIQFTN